MFCLILVKGTILLFYPFLQSRIILPSCDNLECNRAVQQFHYTGCHFNITWQPNSGRFVRVLVVSHMSWYNLDQTLGYVSQMFFGIWATISCPLEALRQHVGPKKCSLFQLFDFLQNWDFWEWLNLTFLRTVCYELHSEHGKTIIKDKLISCSDCLIMTWSTKGIWRIYHFLYSLGLFMNYDRVACKLE